MIAQTLAIEHPRRVLSLCSMLSTTGSRWLRMPKWKAFVTFLVRPPRNREEYVAQGARTFRAIGSPDYPPDRELFRTMSEVSFERGFNPAGVARQLHAINCSGNRARRLGDLRLPATVIHGRDDPLVRSAAGRATARAIHGARLTEIPGMGHDLPPQLWPQFVEEIDANARRAAAGIPVPATA
jgi:pimeloyl-ACP methyl ester carboxylesterase